MSTPKQFGRGIQPVPFEVDGDMFHAVPDIPAENVLTVFTKYRNANEGEEAKKDHQALMDTMKEMLSEFLYDESYQRIERRMRDKEKPIGLGTLTDIIQWLIGEVYGLNPTQG